MVTHLSVAKDYHLNKYNATSNHAQHLSSQKAV